MTQNKKVLVMKVAVRTDNNQNQNQLGDWFWFKPHRKERPYGVLRVVVERNVVA